ncbi:hypothetical protein [Mucilaginibacter paludis]|uniref:Uncharacterized protein n=1 Tax=Mucilaginibacter paludis DSM 18603 TaxID=714943 RepID=H1Y8H9_9SPHI|nr:hypothetical protein [Mucilaginibacter paludis]EHQ25897.1 hypothetical protein Mucpa_1743 [Mucilaginibacter paludis DSM 18603]
MDVIITYDIKRNHTEIKTELKRLDYKDTITGVGINDNKPAVQELPNTTLIKYGAASTKTCLDQVIGVINKHNGEPDRVFCAQLATGFNWNGQ